MDKKLIGILGGTFDPIHNGHLALATNVLNTLFLDEIRFIPCAIPPHRNTPVASIKQRIAMVKLAIQNNPKFILDTRETKRSGKSYTIDTLKSLRQDFPSSLLCLIIGFDELAIFDTWYQWSDILNTCHLIVVSRPEQHKALNTTIETFLKEHQTKNKSDLIKNSHGIIFEITIEPTHISATEIRKKLSNNEKITHELPQAVYQYIIDNQLYKRS